MSRSFRDTYSRLRIGKLRSDGTHPLHRRALRRSWATSTNGFRLQCGLRAGGSAHHRSNYIHPFPDGNGRVSRLMSHAMALTAGIGGHGLWAVSRGLTDRGEYKRMMDLAGTHWRGDSDRRRELSDAAWKVFREWFLKVTLDQITCSAKLFDRGGLDQRYRRLVADTIDDKRAPDLISAVLRLVALGRGDAQLYLKASERRAYTRLSKLTAGEYLRSVSPKRPMRPSFPRDYRERLSSILFGDVDLPE